MAGRKGRFTGRASQSVPGFWEEPIRSIKGRFIWNSFFHWRTMTGLWCCFPGVRIPWHVIVSCGNWGCRKRRSSSGTMISMGSIRQEGWTGDAPGIMFAPWQRRRACPYGFPGGRRDSSGSCTGWEPASRWSGRRRAPEPSGSAGYQKAMPCVKKSARRREKIRKNSCGHLVAG